MRQQGIAELVVHRVSQKVAGDIADSTRAVDAIGFLIVRVRTDQGLEGIGVTYNETGGAACATLIRRVIAPRLIGRDPLATDAIWHELVQYLRGVGRKGLSFCALSAIDIALWDLKGKLLGLPLHRLLGGERTSVPVYASGGWTSYDDDRLVDEMREMVRRGYRMVKFKVGVEGGGNPRRDRARVRKVRDALGPDIRLLIDANNCWDAATAIQFANGVRECDITLFEEPVFADDIPGLARIRRAIDIPLATGEHEYTKWGARDLLLAGAVDILQCDGARAGGYTEMLKIAALAQAWNIRLAPHAMEAVHLPLAAATQNVPFLERLLMFEEITAHVFRDAPVPVNGTMTVAAEPGLGLSLDADFIRDHDEAE